MVRKRQMVDFTGEDIRPGSEFQLTVKASNKAQAVFIALDGEVMRVSRRLADLFDLSDATPVLANWHGQRRTDAFRLTVGELKVLATENNFAK